MDGKAPTTQAATLTILQPGLELQPWVQWSSRTAAFCVRHCLRPKFRGAHALRSFLQHGNSFGSLSFTLQVLQANVPNPLSPHP